MTTNVTFKCGQCGGATTHTCPINWPTEPEAHPNPRVQGYCPVCRGESLFLGSGGYVTCSRLDCPDPSAGDDLLHRRDPDRHQTLETP